MGLRLRIFLGMMTVVICALLATGFVAYRHSVDAEEAYNSQRLLRKEAALQRSLSYMLERLGGSVGQDSLAAVFTDRICELADVHSLTFSLYNQDGGLVTTSAGPGAPDTTVSLRLALEVIQSARQGQGRTVLSGVRGGTEVVWPLVDASGELLALGHVHYDPREVEEADWRTFLARLAPVYFLLFLLVGLLALSLTRSIVGPLRRLSSDMQSNPLDRSAAQRLRYAGNDEIGRLVAAYNRLLEELSDSLSERGKLEREGAWREMAQQVAHEIKNPLTPMKLGAQHLLRAWRDKAPDFDERIVRHTNTTMGQIDALSHIAEGFASLANDGLAQPVEIRVQALVEDVAFGYQGQGVTVEVGPEEACVLADKNRLFRALNNLVKNAVESRDDGRAEVRVSVTASADEVCISVADNGVGIAPDRLERIFEPRFTTKSHGLGLGLAMVRAIVKGAKGSLHVASTVGEGSVFEVRLPRCRA